MLEAFLEEGVIHAKKLLRVEEGTGSTEAFEVTGATGRQGAMVVGTDFLADIAAKDPVAEMLRQLRWRLAFCLDGPV